MSCRHARETTNLKAVGVGEPKRMNGVGERFQACIFLHPFFAQPKTRQSVARTQWALGPIGLLRRVAYRACRITSLGRFQRNRNFAFRQMPASRRVILFASVGNVDRNSFRCGFFLFVLAGTALCGGLTLGCLSCCCRSRCRRLRCMTKVPRRHRRFVGPQPEPVFLGLHFRVCQFR